MPEGKRQNKSKKGRKNGRNRYGDPKCGPANRRYIDQNHRFKNKLRNVEKNNGEIAAKAYQMKYAGLRRETKALVKRKS